MIRILVTGGTFDKEYNELSGQLFFKETHIPEMLALGRSNVAISVETLMMLDSLEITEQGRQHILQRCLDCTESKIIITHGPDTMEETAKTLGPKIGNKTVILTGAMVPYRFGSSDGMFNMGAAVAFAQALPFGVFIAMNGKMFCWDNVTKNRSTGRFEELKPIK